MGRSARDFVSNRALLPILIRRTERLVLVDCDEHGLPFGESASKPTKVVMNDR